jgi:predicted HTH domain antitoxin
MDRDRSLNGPSALNLLSLSKAAERAGTTRFQLSDFLTEQNIPRRYAEEELTEDWKYAAD